VADSKNGWTEQELADRGIPIKELRKKLAIALVSKGEGGKTITAPAALKAAVADQIIDRAFHSALVREAILNDAKEDARAFLLK